MGKKRAYLERATTGELLEEVRRRAVDAFTDDVRPSWCRKMYTKIVDIIGMLPREILDYKPKES